ncbi:MAG TPA: dihydroorotate dehydrogenase electron transfer subunit [Rectinemataceae bacterium]|nr:dihydroorotate dehydrogenase electron transfer subunit [Rectinemataceae bacterium]
MSQVDGEGRACGEEGRDYRREAVLSTRPLGEGIFELVASWQGPAPEAGQFFMMRAARSSLLLGRPISVFDAKEGSLAFVIAQRGEGTRELGELRPGDGLMLEGPLGSTWDFAAISAAGGEGGGGAKPIALVGGGIGLAPLAFLARALKAKSYDIYAGFRSASWGLEDLVPRETFVFTEDGSAGRKGRVLDGFDASRYASVHACGPEPMLRALARLAREAGVPAWLSLERRMACGVGACLGCTVRSTKGNRRACVEGPIFRAEEVFFDE